MADPKRVRATESGGVVDVKILMKHDMETGQRKDSSGKTIPLWHIAHVAIKANDKEVFRGQFGTAISKDPFLNVKFKGAVKGDEVVVSWVDSKGESRTDKAIVT
jgi:sulfur-oxidizing protein SoxZ